MKKYLHKNPYFIIICLILILLSTGTSSFSQKSKNRDVYVDNKGVMRWGDTEEEVYGFGVNYTVPFAHAYRSAIRKGIDPKKAIDQDVYHFSRLGLDLFRVHVWDTEISDTVGNLLENEHLDAFDYLLKKLKDRGIKYVITPIAYWGNGYPEPEEDTPGFSRKYGKGNCLTDPNAIKAQETYLFQFLNHVNPYTGVACKDEPNIIAFEISNEPHHGGEAQAVTDFVSAMVTSMRKTGCKKPIFYNASHSIQFADAYFNADIQGGTFQWYPTGLVSQHEIKGNFLPNVDSYVIPFDQVIKDHHDAKLVYEFDAADIGRSYIYPAMARSFRKAGIQIATHFAYDPMYMADVNTEYFTHYMNLAYAPQKALSLMIASEVFHKIPLYKDFGNYPANANFDGFHVSYEGDLAEYVSEGKFLYTNSTKAKVVDVNELETIAGFGHSEVVQYDGLGAYFLDKIEDNVWRLEVMPDAIWVRNVFGRNVPDKEVAVIKWNEWLMTIKLPGLGNDFVVKTINKGNDYSTTVQEGKFRIKPGTYLLVRKGAKTNISGVEKWKNISLNEFVAPQSTVGETYVVHEPVRELTAGKALKIEATVIAKDKPDEVQLIWFGGWRPTTLKMERAAGYDYKVEIPSDQVRPGLFRYYVSIKHGEDFATFPSGSEGRPGNWEFSDDQMYETRAIEPGNPIYLFDAFRDSDQMMRRWLRGSGMIPTAEPGKGEYVVNVEKLFEVDPENTGAEKIYDYSMKFYFQDNVKGRISEWKDKNKLVLTGRSLNGKPCILQLAFAMKDGAAYGGNIVVRPEKGDFTLDMKDLKQVKFVTLPRPYPTFLPYYFENKIPEPFDMQNAESLQFSIGLGIPESEVEQPHGVAIESVRLE